MNKIEIIFAQDENTLYQCLKIREEVFTTEKGVPREIEADALDCLNGPCGHFLIRFNGADIGTFRCAYMPENIVRIQRLCILKEFRGRGFGKAALAYVESHYQPPGCAAIELDAKYDALPFYEKCGYKKTSKPFTEAGILHVKMRKKL